MKEFIEKLIGRLKECEKEYTSEYGMIDIQIREVFVKIRKIVNQLVAEQNNDYCEWRKGEYGDSWKPNCCDEIYDLRGVRKFKFCPYCGKKMKVVE